MPENTPMVSEVTICNQALSWVGQNPITALTDRTPSAVWCLNNYAFIRDAVLEERMWTFATVKMVSETADRDEWGQYYAHAIPEDWLAVFRCFRSVDIPGREVPSEDWRREGNRALARESKVYLWGLLRESDTGQFSSMFVQALAARLAADMAIPITQNVVLQGNLWKLYGAKLQEAAVRDGQQGANEVITQHKLTNSRFRSGTA